jgi:hypothetical protein
VICEIDSVCDVDESVRAIGEEEERVLRRYFFLKLKNLV